MKLLYCEIENYGNLTGEKIRVNGELQEFCENNGYGKTTLCSFIRVMFYGMETRREKDVSFGDREHFYPFSGGRFGGSLTFLYSGKTCRIERFFDEKTATKDSFSYFENGEEVKKDGDTIGKEIFGIDEEAFCRSLFFDSAATEIAATDGMREKLGAIAEGTEGGRNVAEATEFLEKKRKEISADRKNANCEIFRYDEMRKKLAAEAEDLRRQSETIDSLYSRRAELQGVIEQEERQEEILSKRETLIAKTAAYFELLAQAKEQEKKSAEIAARYPSGVFTEEEIARLRAAQTETARLSFELSARTFPQKKAETLEKLNAAFRSGVPAQEVIARKEEEIKNSERLEAALATPITLTQREKELFEKFDGKQEAQAEITRAVSLGETCRAADKEIIAESSRIVTPAFPAQSGGAESERKKTGRVKTAFFAVLGALLLITGGIWCVTNAAAGAALCIGGALALAAALFLGYKGRKSGAERYKNSEPAYSPVNEKIALLREEKGRAEGEIAAFLYRYGYSAENVYASLERAANDYKDYAEAKKRLAAAQNERSGKQAEKRRIDEDLTEYFTPFRLTDGAYSERLRRLKNWIELHAELTEEKLKTEEYAARLRKREEEIREDTRQIFASRGVAIPDKEELEKTIEKLSADAAEYRRYVSAGQEFNEKAVKYRATQDLPTEAFEKPSAVTDGEKQGTTAAEIKARAEELRALLRERRKELAATEREITEAEDAAEKLAQKQRELIDLREKTADAEERAKLYRTAAEILKQADNAVMQRYVEPVRERFVTYADLIEKTLGLDVTMNRDFSLSFTRGSARRKDGHLSAGARYVCAFCLRLALIDEMFSGREQPFLILDDPFVHLDEAHFAKTAALVCELSKKRQFLYFTCHASRSVNGAIRDKRL